VEVGNSDKCSELCLLKKLFLITINCRNRQQIYPYRSMKHIFLGLLLLTLIGACTESPDSRKQNAECYVRFLAQEEQWFAEVTLREENATKSEMLAIESPAGVRYQGIRMSVLPVQGITYRLEQAGGYSETQQFDWQDTQNQDYSLKLDMPAIVRFSFGTDRLSNKKPATLRWDGKPLEQQESMVMMWEQADGKFTVPMEIRGTAGQDRIEFPAAQLSKLPAGTWVLYLVRKKRVKQKINGTNTIAVLEYYSHSDTLQIVD
jgi:hypothetical protein